MDKKFIIAAAMLLSVVALIVVLYITSAVLHKIPPRIALIVGVLFAVPDIIIAIVILTKPVKPD